MCIICICIMCIIHIIILLCVLYVYVLRVLSLYYDKQHPFNDHHFENEQIMTFFNSSVSQFHLYL